MIETRRKQAENLVANDPKRDAELARLEHRAAVHIQKKQLDDAIRILGEALAIHQASMKQAGADVSKESKASARLLHSCSKLFMAKGDTENAVRARRDAAQMTRVAAQAAAS